MSGLRRVKLDTFPRKRRLSQSLITKTKEASFLNVWKILILLIIAILVLMYAADSYNVVHG